MAILIRIKGQQKEKDDPSYFLKMKLEISVFQLEWSNLFESNKQKLKYMANILEIKDISVQNQEKTITSYI